MHRADARTAGAPPAPTKGRAAPSRRHDRETDDAHRADNRRRIHLDREGVRVRV